MFLSHTRLANHVLLRTLATVVTRDRETTAELLALMAEVDKRQLFRGEGYPSMYRYCVEKLRMSEDVAYKRIQTARAARWAENHISASAVAVHSNVIPVCTASDAVHASNRYGTPA